MNTNHAPAPLHFADAVRIATGCTDYGGGYRSNAALLEAYQSGIATVINALRAAQERGMADQQVRALHGMGAAPLLLDALRDCVALIERDMEGDRTAQPELIAARAAIAAATN
jgi:hypothetical protein